MTKDELIKKASHKAVLILERDGLGNPKTLFHDIHHYFNDDMQEIGMIYDPWGRAVVATFDPPRVWHDSIRMGYKIEHLHKKKIIDPEYEHIHKELGCFNCRYCEGSMLFRGSCCTYGGKLKVNKETGECLIRREVNRP